MTRGSGKLPCGVPLRLAANREVLDALSGHGRWTYALAAQINETRLGKEFSSWWGANVSRRALSGFVSNRLVFEGGEYFPTDRSLIMVGNHRTYFDFFAVTQAIWDLWENGPFIYCPVRSTFYYDGPVGAWLNWMVCGTSMYPPVYRSKDKRVLNQHAVSACIRLLDWSPRTVIGMHPEGRRNTSDDPYAFLPAKPGVGRIALGSEAPLIPVFIGGLPGSFREIMKRRLGADAEPVRIIAGPPVDIEDLRGDPDDPAAHQAVAERTMEHVARLGERDRELFADWQASRSGATAD